MRLIAAVTVAAVGLLGIGGHAPNTRNPGPRTRVPSPPMVDYDAIAAEEQERAVAAYFAALEAEKVAAYLEAMRPRIAVDWARWQRLHVCEQSNTWYANGGNAADPAHQTFQGGLGMSTVAWQMAVRAAAARGVTLPASALAASPEEQMTGAQAFYDAYGWAWACHV